jgi:general secretion pathway protein M
MRERLRVLWSDLQGWYGRLTARERVLVGSAGGAGGVFLVFLVLYLLSSSAAATRKRTESKLLRLAEAEQLATGYAEAERARKQAEAALTAGEFSLMTDLSDKGTRAGIFIPTLNPRGEVPVGDGRILESDVELTLTDVQLTKVVTFLSSVEQGPGVVRVKFLRIEPRTKDGVLTAWTTVASYRLKGGP